MTGVQTCALPIFSFPLMLGILALADPFIITVFGTKWRPVILLIIILAPVGFLQSIGTTTGSVYQAKGRTDWMLRWGIGAGTFVMIAFVIGLHWGIVGVASAYAVAVVILTYPSFAIPFRLINLKFSRLLKVLWKPFINSLIMFIAILTFRNVLPMNFSSAVVLILSIALGIIVYAAASWVNSKEQLRELWGLSGFKGSAK